MRLHCGKTAPEVATSEGRRSHAAGRHWPLGIEQTIGSHGWLLIREALLLTSLLALYSGARLVAGQHVASAFNNATHVLHIEFLLHLPREQSVQALMLSHADIIRAANVYYAGAHLPMTAAALIWLFVFRPPYYLWARRALLSATAAALVIYTLFPVAPPRMLGSLGFVDTGKLYGQSVYGPATAKSVTNQFAAMPSLHVGWAVLIATICIAAGTSRWRWLWVLHPLVTVLVVVSTGNHYWLDALVGAGLVTVTMVVTRHRQLGLTRFRVPLVPWRLPVPLLRRESLPIAQPTPRTTTGVTAVTPVTDVVHTTSPLGDLRGSELVDTRSGR